MKTTTVISKPAGRRTPSFRSRVEGRSSSTSVREAGVDAFDLAVEGRADEHADHDEPDHGIDDERQLALLLQAQLSWRSRASRRSCRDILFFNSVPVLFMFLPISYPGIINSASTDYEFQFINRKFSVPKSGRLWYTEKTETEDPHVQDSRCRGRRRAAAAVLPRADAPRLPAHRRSRRCGGAAGPSSATISTSSSRTS